MPPSIWDQYQFNQPQGWTPPPGIEGTPNQNKVTTGATGGQNPSANPTPAAPPVPPIPSPPTKPYTLPAVNNFMQGNPSGAMTNFGPQFQPGNISAPNDYQPGSIGDGLGTAVGQSFTSPYASLFNQQSQPQQPNLTGYHWWKGTGGVSGGNNERLNQFYSDGTSKSFTGGVENNQPLTPTQYAAPLLNGERSPFADPSVGALKGATRYSEMGRKRNVVIGPESGGTMVGGASLRKPQKMTAGQTWSLGGWY